MEQSSSQPQSITGESTETPTTADLKLVGAAHWALEHFYHLDKANACMHGAPVRFSPITFRLAESLDKESVQSGIVREVISHKGKYQEDTGRE